MIYLVTHQKELFVDDFPFKLATMDECIIFLNTLDEIALDSETTGLDCHGDKLFLLQLGNLTHQYIIDCSGINISILKPILENKLIVGQGLKFDLKFLYKQGIYPRKIYDTYVVEKVLNCGLIIKADLNTLCSKYLGYTLDKSIRKDIAKKGLTIQVLKYSADDIICLPQIKEKQLEKVIEQDLKGTINLEHRFTPCLAYIEYCGFKLDVVKWKQKMESDKTDLITKEKVLNQWIMDKGLKKYFTQQLDLFQEVDCKINWASPSQVIELFEDLNIPCYVYVKGIKKKSVEANVIQKYTKDFEIIELYLAYKKADKVVGTYGQSFLNQINRVTGRIHTSFKQILDTGRISSGGKDKGTGENYINFQNIPSDKLTRSCFIAEPGNTLIISDYTGQEQIVLANRALDPNILKFYDEGLGDMHAFVASKMYSELKSLSLDQIKKDHKKKRQKAKIAGFAINISNLSPHLVISE